MSLVNVVVETFEDLDVSPIITEENTADAHDDELPTENVACSGDEYDTDIEISDTKEAYDATGRSTYFEACKKLGTTPVSYFLKHMENEEIHLQYRGIGPVGVKAISAALMSNTVTLKLNLMENYIGLDGLQTFCEMLKENCYLTDVNLSMNYLGPEGCCKLCEALQQSIGLSRLDISRNNFGDFVGPYLADAFKNNFKLTHLDLSGNHLSEKAGAAFGAALGSNDAIEYLNLSWNQLRRKATSEIGIGLKSNITLKSLNLSWNGFSNEGAVFIADALKTNNTLVDLDISYNRIGINGALIFAKSLEVNYTLEKLKLDGNPITNKGAIGLLTTVYTKPDCPITELHMKGVSVHEDFVNFYNKNKDTKDVIVYADFRTPSPLERLQQFIKTNKNDWLEVFVELDETSINRVHVEEFWTSLKKLGFEFETEERVGLLRKLKKDSQARIKYRDPLLGFSNAPPPPPPPAKKSVKTKSKPKKK